MRLSDLTEAEDPHRAMAELRRQHPVAEVDGFVVVTGYDAVMTVMHSEHFVSGPIAARYRDALPSGAARDEMANRINFLDPPDHGRVRRLVSKAFTPRRIEDLRPWIARTATGLLDETDTEHPFDLLEVAHVLPSLVISKLLGVPAADRDRLTAWSDAVSPLLGMSVATQDKQRAVAAAEQFHAYLADLIEQRRRVPSDDLLSALVEAEEDGDRLSMNELRSLAATLYSAGHRTTRDTLCNGMTVLLGAAGAGWRRLVQGEWTVPDVVEEILRHQTPTLFVARVAARDAEVGGLVVAQGTPVLLFLAAANRDPARYHDPDAFLPGRGGPAAASFAHGAHYCLGASLARAELQVLLDVLVERLPTLRLTEPPIWHVRGPFRGVDELMVSVG